MLTIKTKKQAVTITHTLSNPEKMPCKGYSLPASECKTGSKLRLIAGSVCSDCYACKGCYQFPVVKSALQKRLDSINHPLWIEAMSVNIKGNEFFRWHDSGDIQNEKHLKDIFKICENTPNTSHWLPTKENAILKRVLKTHAIPENLNIRYSMPMVNDTPKPQTTGVNTSTSVTTESQAFKNGTLCEAYTRDGICGDCRKCWNKEIKNVTYLMH